MATKKKEEFEMMTGKEVITSVSLLCDVLPEDKLEDLYAILFKALTKENLRHYVTKPETSIKNCLSATQAKKFDTLIKTLVKTNVE